MQLLPHCDFLDLSGPRPEGGDIRRDRIGIDTIHGEYRAVLALIGRNFDRPASNEVERLAIDRLAFAFRLGRLQQAAVPNRRIP